MQKISRARSARPHGNSLAAMRQRHERITTLSEQLLTQIRIIKVRGGRLSGYQNLFGADKGSDRYRADIAEYVRLRNELATHTRAALSS